MEFSGPLLVGKVMGRYEDQERKYGDLLDCLAGLLRDHAPSIGLEVPADRFTGEAAGILTRLHDARSPEHLAELMRSVFARGFSAKMAGPASQYEPVARQFWSICQGRGFK